MRQCWRALSAAATLAALEDTSLLPKHAVCGFVDKVTMHWCLPVNKTSTSKLQTHHIKTAPNSPSPHTHWTLSQVTVIVRLQLHAHLMRQFTFLRSCSRSLPWDPKFYSKPDMLVRHKSTRGCSEKQLLIRSLQILGIKPIWIHVNKCISKMHIPLYVAPPPKVDLVSCSGP